MSSSKYDGHLEELAGGGWSQCHSVLGEDVGCH